jgi:hypothetical protein
MLLKKYIDYEYTSGNTTFVVRINKNKYKRIIKEEWYYPHFFARVVKECDMVILKDAQSYKKTCYNIPKEEIK